MFFRKNVRIFKNNSALKNFLDKIEGRIKSENDPEVQTDRIGTTRDLSPILYFDQETSLFRFLNGFEAKKRIEVV